MYLVVGIGILERILGRIWKTNVLLLAMGSDHELLQLWMTLIAH